MRQQPFRARREGMIAFRLTSLEQELLRFLPEILESVGGRDDDPAAARMTPVAHPGDPAEERRFLELTGRMLDEARDQDRRRFATSLGPDGVLDPDTAEAWLRVIGETRLVLAARLGIQEDGWEDLPPSQFPQAIVWLRHLSMLQDALVAALSDTLD